MSINPRPQTFSEAMMTELDRKLAIEATVRMSEDDVLGSFMRLQTPAGWRESFPSKLDGAK